MDFERGELRGNAVGRARYRRVQLGEHGGPDTVCCEIQICTEFQFRFGIPFSVGFCRLARVFSGIALIELDAAVA